jgi:hypothetical protein
MTNGFDTQWARRWLLAAVVSLLAIGAVLIQQGAWARSGDLLSLSGQQSLSEASQSVELIMFEEVGCPWCRRWHAEVGPGYPHSVEGKRAPLRIVQLRDAPSSAAKLSSPVRTTPTFVLVSSEREVGRITGYPGAEFFWPMLGDLLSRLTPDLKPDRHARLGQIVP